MTPVGEVSKWRPAIAPPAEALRPGFGTTFGAAYSLSATALATSKVVLRPPMS